MTSAEIRQSFLDFFEEHGHTIVPSASLVPGGDQTLLFTNAGMVQFKDVFLGTGTRPYTRAANAQKCMRVAGKHNDLEDVGRDDTHHTYFEMLGNWSFGDYYKKETITWAWQLLTDVWGLPKDKLWATCFEDELGEIPRDDQAAEIWRQQPGFDPEHVLFFGREENFWEMAETGPCGPDSEIHFDRGPEFCNMHDVPGHVCQVNGDCQRYLELWNLVFIQYNRTSATHLDPLPAKHVDTGLGFERLVSVMQDVDSNYKTDLFIPLLQTVQALTGHDDQTLNENLTAYRVIADHGRAAAFLIADGVVPGNVGRNYVCRMIIRRASRFGGKIGLNNPFLANVAETVIEQYGDFYPELVQNRSAILQTITDEERRFQRTLDIGMSHFYTVLEETRAANLDVIPGTSAFDLYATYGLPFEITRDLAQEQGFDTDADGFYAAMEIHKVASSSAMESATRETDDLELYRTVLDDLKAEGKLGKEGVRYDPYTGFEIEGPILALFKNGKQVKSAVVKDRVSVVLPETHFYIEAGGQVADTGAISSVDEPSWKISIEDTREPLEGLILHEGRVVSGTPTVGQQALAAVDETRRWDIMRNHTATHLLHAALRQVLGDRARQAGSLVAPDRLRFDVTHGEPMTQDEIEAVEKQVNEAILDNYELEIRNQPREQAIHKGAMALFGETYGDTVRTVTIGDEGRISYELCGGTHVGETGAIGPFLVVGEGSVAAGIRRIEAVTGRGAQSMIQERMQTLSKMAERLGASVDKLEARLEALLTERDQLTSEIINLRSSEAVSAYQSLQPVDHNGVPVLIGELPNADTDTLRQLTDRFRSENPSGVVVLASVVDGQPILVAAVTKDLVARGLHASELVQNVARVIGGGGGGKPTLAQAGGKDASKLSEALALVHDWVSAKQG